MSPVNKTLAAKKKAQEIDRLTFHFLPAFAQHVIDHSLEQYVLLSIKYSREEDIPLLKLLAHFSEDQLLQLGKQSGLEFLTFLAENRAVDYIEKSVNEFSKNQIPFFEREQVVAEDITSISFVRRKTFRELLKSYTSDFDFFGKIMEEVDRFIAESESKSFNAYLQVQQENINEMNIKLATREQELLEAQQLAGMGSFLWRFDGEKSSFTPGLMEIFDMDAGSGLETFLEFVHADDRQKLREAIDQAMTGDGLYECEYRFIKNNTEKIIWSKGKVTQLHDKPHYMKGTVMDITQKSNLLQKLQQNKKELESKTEELELLNHSLEYKNLELERMNKELESFNYIASHDLQEPLRKIQLFTNRIIEKSGTGLNPTAVEYLEKIGSSSARMKMLIEDLLIFSQSIIREENFEFTNLNLMLHDVQTTLAAIIEDKKVIIECDFLPVLRVVPFQFQQVLLNLIVNAIKYTAENTVPHIKISAGILSGKDLKFTEAQPDKSYCEIRVADNGIGFDESHAESIFKLFHRLHKKDEYSGTGIGLAICKKIVQNHQGFIKANSVPGKGSVFSFFLPHEPQPQKQRLAN
jgi:signal transduction histidine kinase